MARLSPTSALELAKCVVARAKLDGFAVSVRGFVLSVSKEFPAGDRSAYGYAESEAEAIIAMVPTTQHNVWGTTSDGVGAYSAVLHGRMTLNVSTVPATFTKALAKVMA